MYICNACRALGGGKHFTVICIPIIIHIIWRIEMKHDPESQHWRLKTKHWSCWVEKMRAYSRPVCLSVWGIHLELRLSMQKEQLVKSSFSKLSCQLVMSSLILWHPSKNQSFWNIVFIFIVALLNSRVVQYLWKELNHWNTAWNYCYHRQNESISSSATLPLGIWWGPNLSHFHKQRQSLEIFKSLVYNWRTAFHVHAEAAAAWAASFTHVPHLHSEQHSLNGM